MNDQLQQERKENLFEITGVLAALEEVIAENDGEITEDIDQWLDEYQAKLHEKLNAYCYLIHKYQDIATEAKRLASRGQIYSNKVKRLKERLHLYLQHAGQSKVETDKFTVKIQSNGGKLPVRLKEGIDAANLPESYCKTTGEPDYETLRQALEAGDPQAQQIAEIQPRDTHLRIT